MNTNSVPQPRQIRIAPPPQRPEILTGPECDRLQRTATNVRAKGHLLLTRFTAPIKGEQFILQIHAARVRSTGEIWHSATYTSATIPGHSRTALIDPSGQVWLFFPASDRDAAKCVRSKNKYTLHLTQVFSQQKGR